MIERYKLCANLDRCLLELEQNVRLAVAVSRKHAMNSLHIPQSKIFCFADDQNLYSYPIVMYLSSNQSLLSRVNSFIRMSLETGLYAKWSRDNERIGKKNEKREIDDRNNRHQRRHKQRLQLTFEHIFVGLCVYVIGINLALILFILELTIHRKAHRYRASKFWRLSNMFFDGKRYFLLNVRYASKTQPNRRTVFRLVNKKIKCSHN